MVAIPVAMFVQRHQEHLVGSQKAQDLGTVMGITNSVAQLAAKTFLGRGVIKECLHLGGQAIDHLFQQIIADQPFPAVKRLGQCTLRSGFGRRQQPETQTGYPAFTALDQVLQRFTAQGTTVPIEQAQGFIVGQAQVLFMQLKQLP
ncbi:hypothetical protein D3C87_1322700 [compost metagenome]